MKDVTLLLGALPILVAILFIIRAQRRSEKRYQDIMELWKKDMQRMDQEREDRAVAAQLAREPSIYIDPGTVSGDISAAQLAKAVWDQWAAQPVVRYDASELKRDEAAMLKLLNEAATSSCAPELPVKPSPRRKLDRR